MFMRLLDLTSLDLYLFTWTLKAEFNNTEMSTRIELMYQKCV